MTGEANVYDELPYVDRAFSQAHPDRLAVVGRLYGMSPAPVDRCRVLEIGCGMGGNLIAIAAGLPDSRFLGIDLSGRQIDHARSVAGQIGLANVEFRRQDLMDFGPREGPFDYIICHGVYSWVPPPAQERILSICRAALAPQGLATISYNTYPGWHIRGAVREVLQFGARGAAAPAERARQAVEFLRFVARSVFLPEEPFGRAIRDAAESVSAESVAYVFHEYLEAHNEPVGFEEFSRRAAGAGLRYVGDGEMRNPVNLLTEEARDYLKSIEEDRVRCETVLDLLRHRSFRWDVLCHEGVATERWPEPAGLKGMLLSPLAECLSKGPLLAAGAEEKFRNAQGQTLTTGEPAMKAAMLALQAARPRGLAYDRLMEQVRAMVGQVDEPGLAEALLACAMVPLVELHTYLPPMAGRAGERPRAAPAARWRAAAGRDVVNLRHRTIRLDELSLAVLAMLDGTRDRPGLCKALSERAGGGELTLPPDVPKAVDEVLTTLADLGLLEDTPPPPEKPGQASNP